MLNQEARNRGEVRTWQKIQSIGAAGPVPEFEKRRESC